MGCNLLESSAEQWTVESASWRFDLEFEVDLIEEIARVDGYDNIEASPLTSNMQLGRTPEDSLPAAAGKLSSGVRPNCMLLVKGLASILS